MKEHTYLGNGMKFPMEVNPATGRIMEVGGRESVRQSIYMLLMIQKSEMMTKPGFGSSIMNYTFMDMTDTMLQMMARELRADILLQEPRISHVDIRMEPDREEGRVLVYITYELASDHSRDSLVFPFYLEA